MTTVESDLRLVSADVAILDDDPNFVRLAEALLRRNGNRCRTFFEPEEALAALAKRPADVLLLDYQLESCRGTELVQPFREVAEKMEIIFVTAHSSPEVAVSALQAGASDFLTKPLDEGRLIASIANAVKHAGLVERVTRLESQDPTDFEGMVGQSPAIQTVFRTIDNVAPTDVAVMVRGESGTGKELAARAIHTRSKRNHGPFVALNMAALPENLVESTLFGHEKGAFTGASGRRLGACEEAAGGTLFLDEICEMPIDLQAKLLRFLQEGVFRRVGGNQDIRSDARIVSATNRDPLHEVREGRFRQDLYYRLNVVPVDLPPLRERQGDVALLANGMLAELNERYGREFAGFTPSALTALEANDWPGNVRELLHVVERVTVLNDAREVTESMLPPEVLSPAPAEVSPPEPGPNAHSIATRAPSQPGATSAGDGRANEAPPEDEPIVPLDELERRAIENALTRLGGSVPRAAEALRVSQATIYRKIKTYGIDRGRFAR